MPPLQTVGTPFQLRSRMLSKKSRQYLAIIIMYHNLMDLVVFDSLGRLISLRLDLKVKQGLATKIVR